MSLKRIAIAAGIVLAGVAAALPFRQSSSSSPPPPKPAITPLALTLRKADAPIELAPRIEISPATNFTDMTGDALGANDRGRETGDRKQDAEATILAPPPALPVSFQPSMLSPTVNDWRPEKLLTAPRPPSLPKPYRLRDGDTLERIAERLLGDASRASEIFEANRNVLSRPDLLPVGVVITLPPRATADRADLIPTNTSRLTAPK